MFKDEHILFSRTGSDFGKKQCATNRVLCKIEFDMDAAAKYRADAPVNEPPKTMESPNPNSSQAAAERRQREERLIALYMEMTGVSESAARSVYMHLDLNRQDQ